MIPDAKLDPILKPWYAKKLKTFALFLMKSAMPFPFEKKVSIVSWIPSMIFVGNEQMLQQSCAVATAEPLYAKPLSNNSTFAMPLVELIMIVEFLPSSDNT